MYCDDLEEWQRIVSGGDDEEEEEDKCLCNMIRTFADAASVGVETKSLQDDCKLYTPKFFDRHYLQGQWSGDDDDLFLLSGKIGAAKGEIFFLGVDGGDELPDVKAVATNPGLGIITLRSVCVSPNTLAIPIKQCKDCKKEIEFNYNYQSRGEIFVSEGDNLFYEEKIGITMEEFATLFVDVNGSGGIIDTVGYKLLAACNGDSGWNLDSIFTNGKNLYNVIKDLSGVDSYIDAAQTVAGVVTRLLISGCSVLNNEVVGMSGIKKYILEPGERFKAMLYSTTTYKGRGQSSVMGYATVLSDYYMSVVVKTIPDSSGHVPNYCACEAIAAYTWGSMDGFTPSSKRPRDRDKDQVKKWPDFAGIYDYPPLGEIDIKQLIGAFIGTAGDWGDKFDKAGCCSVVIPCHADCVYIVNEDCHNIHSIQHPTDKISIAALERTSNGYIQSNSKHLILDQQQTVNIRQLNNNIAIYPNPSNDILNLEYVVSKDDIHLKAIEIYTVTGEKIYNIGFQDGKKISTLQIDISLYGEGLYFIRSVYSDGANTIHKFIKM